MVKVDIAMTKIPNFVFDHRKITLLDGAAWKQLFFVLICQYSKLTLLNSLSSFITSRFVTNIVQHDVNVRFVVVYKTSESTDHLGVSIVSVIDK